MQSHELCRKNGEFNIFSFDQQNKLYMIYLFLFFFTKNTKDGMDLGVSFLKSVRMCFSFIFTFLENIVSSQNPYIYFNLHAVDFFKLGSIVTSIYML